MSSFIHLKLQLFSVWLQSEYILSTIRLQTTPLYSNSSFMILYIILMIFPERCYCSDVFRFNSRPAHIFSSLPVPADFCPPVIPVVRLSEIIMVTGEFLHTASRRPVMPECVKVEIADDRNRREQSPISGADGHCDRCPHIDT